MRRWIIIWNFILVIHQRFTFSNGFLLLFSSCSLTFIPIHLSLSLIIIHSSSNSYRYHISLWRVVNISRLWLSCDFSIIFDFLIPKQNGFSIIWFERTLWRLFLKRIVRTHRDIPTCFLLQGSVMEQPSIYDVIGHR
jgi:hypothetical protein